MIILKKRLLEYAFLIVLIIGIVMFSYTLILLPESASFDYLANLKSQKKEFDEKASQLQQKITLLENRIQTLEQQIINSYDNMSINQQGIQNPAQQLAQLNSEIVDLQQQSNDVQYLLVSTRQSLESAEQELHDYQLLILQNEKDIERMRRWLEEERPRAGSVGGYSEDLIKATETAIGMSGYTIKLLIEESDRCQKNIDDLQSRVMDLESKESQLQSILDADLAKKRQLEDLILLKSDLEKTQIELQDMNKQILKIDNEISLTASQICFRCGGIILIILSSVSLITMQYKRKRSARADFLSWTIEVQIQG